MIVSFRSKTTEQIWNGNRVKKMPIQIQKIGRRKLRMLNNSQNIADLRIPPSNRLEKLSGDLSGFYSIRINKQGRIIFEWNNGNASEVETSLTDGHIIDYH
jgi:proteic killer suppression protein